MQPTQEWYVSLGRVVTAAAELEGNAAYLAVRMGQVDTGEAQNEWTAAWEMQLCKRTSETLGFIGKRASGLSNTQHRQQVIQWVAETRQLFGARDRNVHSIIVHGIAKWPFEQPPVGHFHPRSGQTSDLPEAAALLALANDFQAASLKAVNLAALADIAVANATGPDKTTI